MQFQSLFFALFAATQVASQGCRPMAGGLVYNCGNNQDALVLQNVRLMGKPERGRSFKVQVDGVLREAISPGAKVSINFMRQGRTVLNLNRDLCEIIAMRNTGDRCPIKAQKLSRTQTIDIPRFAPRGQYTIEASGFNRNNRRIFKVIIYATI